MPNWCYSNIRFKGGDTAKLYIFLKEAFSKNRLENSWGKDWLGNALLHAGIDEETVVNRGDAAYSCRGSVEDFGELQGDEFEITTETAWGPMIQMFVTICEKMGFTGIQIDWFAEEPGMGFYQASSPEMADGAYHVEGNVDDSRFESLVDSDGGPFWSADELTEELREIYGDGKTLDEMIQAAENEKLFDADGWDGYISICPVKVVDPIVIPEKVA